MFFPVSAWFPAFILTVAIETPIVWALARRSEPDWRRLGILVLFANLATHPLVWFVFTQLFLVGTLAYTLAAESWAIAAEAVFYTVAMRLTVRRAVTVALAANVVSFVVGRLVGELWPDIIW